MQMSKGFRPIPVLIAALILMLYSHSDVSGQTVSVSIKIDRSEPAKAMIAGKRTHAAPATNLRNLAFRNNIHGSLNLAARVSEVQVFAENGTAIGIKKLIDGEYLADSDIHSWRYVLDLTPPRPQTAAAHVSWIAGDHGLLMLDDLLPLTAVGRGEIVLVFLEIPKAWKVFSSGATVVDSKVVATADWKDVVIAIGEGWSEKASAKNGFDLNVVVHSDWLFADDEAAHMAREVLDEYAGLFGSYPVKAGSVLITRFPNPTRPGAWEAETRGNTVTIISSDMPFRTQSLQRLHEQFRHELFHLWIPNGVNLTGNYDWFYEGFALYQSLKLAVALNRIRFEDFLDTLSRAHAIDSAQSQRTSLIQASATRFSGANTQVYARGMLVAFLCDLALLQQSKGKRSVEDVLREVFVRYRAPAEPTEGNTAVINLLKANPELVPLVDKYITGSDKLEWTAELAGVGIEDSDAGPLTSLRVKDKLNGRQKALLDKLGYNNWRKLSRTSK